MTRKDVLAKAIISGEVSLTDIEQVREYLTARHIFFELRSIRQGSRQQVQIFQKGKGWLSLTDWKDNYLQGLQAELMSLQQRCESLGLTTMDQALSIEQKVSALPEVFVICNVRRHKPGSSDLSSLFCNMKVGVADENGRFWSRKPRYIALSGEKKHRVWIEDTDSMTEVDKRIQLLINRSSADDF